MSRVVGKEVFTYGITRSEREIPYVEGKGETTTAMHVIDSFNAESSHLVPERGPLRIDDGSGDTPASQHCSSNGFNAYVGASRDVYLSSSPESRYDFLPALPQSRLMPHDRGFISATTNGMYYTELPIDQSVSYGHVYPEPVFCRPVGAMSHNDIIAGYTPTVTQSVWPGVQIAASSASSAVWTPGVNVTAVETDTKVTFTFGSSVTPGQVLGSCATSVEGASLRWMMLDVSLSGDSQKYDTTGFFVNDQSMLTSGYVIRLENAGNTDFKEYRIPKIQTLGTVNKYLIYTGPVGFDVATVKLQTDTLYTTGDGRSFTLYTGIVTPWIVPGNWALPDVSWKASPMYETLAGTTINVSNTETAQDEMITDGQFPTTSPAGWGLTGYPWFGSLSGTGAVVQGDGIYKSPMYRLEIDGKRSGSDVSSVIDLGLSNDMEVEAGKQYQIEWYDYGDTWYQYAVSLYISDSLIGNTWDDVASVPRMSLVTFAEYATASVDPYTLGYVATTPLQWFSPSARFGWQKKSVVVTVPAGVTHVRIGFSNKPMLDRYMNNMSIDDVSMKALPVSNVGAAYFVNTMTESGDDMRPDLPRMRYVVSMAYRTNYLNNAGWKLMISNPSEPSTGNHVADPWRTPAVTADAVNSIITAYGGSYIAGVMVYRAFKWPEVGEWEPYTFIGGIQSHSGSFTDNLSPDAYPTSFAGKAVNEEPEMYADYPSEAKYVMQSAGRLYAGNLDNGARRTAIQVSGYDKPWAFTTTYDDNTPWTAGTELDGYAITGTEIRALVMRADEKVVLLDTEVFSLRGSSPSQGYQFVKVAGVGCVSHASVVDCNGMLVWSNGDDFYAYVGADAAVNLSRNKVGPIDWTKPHSATYYKGRYMCYATDAEDGVAKVFQYTLADYAWTVHRLIAPANTVSLYGKWALDSDGALFEMLAGSKVQGAYASGSYWKIAPDGYDAHASRIVLDIKSDGETNVGVAVDWQGAVVGRQEYSITVDATHTRHYLPCNINANCVKVSVLQSGDPATVYHIGVEVDDIASR